MVATKSVDLFLAVFLAMFYELHLHPSGEIVNLIKKRSDSSIGHALRQKIVLTLRSENVNTHTSLC